MRVESFGAIPQPFTSFERFIDLQLQSCSDIVDPLYAGQTEGIFTAGIRAYCDKIGLELLVKYEGFCDGNEGGVRAGLLSDWFCSC